MSDLSALMRNEIDCLAVGPASQHTRQRLVLLPGAFNPLHAGHQRIAQHAAARLQKEVHFEMSIANVDKQLLNEAVCTQRLDQFQPAQTVWITRAPLFTDKARLFPRATFVVGADTIIRVGDPQYYDDEAQMAGAIRRLVEAECSFLVYGRVASAGQFSSLSDLAIPGLLRSICDEVAEVDFRCDLSSTELRSQQRGQSPGRTGSAGSADSE